MGRSAPSNPAAGNPAPAGRVCIPCQAAADPCSGQGFADPAFIGDFMGDFKQDVVANWATQTPDQRFAAVKALQEKQFTAFGIPTSSVSRSTDPALGFDDPVTMFGQANAGPWNMTFNGNLFTSPTLSPTDQTELAKTMMHEGRHIESTTRRRNTGRRKGRPQPTSARSTRPPTSPSGCRRT